MQGLTGWHFLIILVVILLLFGAPKLPALARSLGQSMKILKSEIRPEKDDGNGRAGVTPCAAEQAEAPADETRRGRSGRASESHVRDDGSRGEEPREADVARCAPARAPQATLHLGDRDRGRRRARLVAHRRLRLGGDPGAGAAVAEAQGTDTAIVFPTISSAFDLRLQIAFTLGIVISSPVWLYQIFAFLVPGLSSRERRFTFAFFASAIPLFLAGCAAGWFVLPNIVHLMTSFVPSDAATLLTAQASTSTSCRSS